MIVHLFLCLVWSLTITSAASILVWYVITGAIFLVWHMITTVNSLVLYSHTYSQYPGVVYDCSSQNMYSGVVYD